mmetsp:Transcript_50454/g.150898  ORF Transcript_50454/g.150898 Transcript_50454/m.150898 type:complete len:227 (+) Transcript_50454:737-1417(+)
MPRPRGPGRSARLPEPPLPGAALPGLRGPAADAHARGVALDRGPRGAQGALAAARGVVPPGLPLPARRRGALRGPVLRGRGRAQHLLAREPAAPHLPHHLRPGRLPADEGAGTLRALPPQPGPGVARPAVQPVVHVCGDAHTELWPLPLREVPAVALILQPRTPKPQTVAMGYEHRDTPVQAERRGMLAPRPWSVLEPQLQSCLRRRAHQRWLGQLRRRQSRGGLR